MELIISTAYMALAAVVCVRLYLYAHTVSTDSSARTHAITQAQNMIVSFRSGSGTLTDAAWNYQETAEKYPGVLNGIRALSSEPDAAAISQLSFEYDEDWYLTGIDASDMDLSGSAEAGSGSDGAASTGNSDSAWRMDVSLADSTDTPGIRILTITVRNTQQGKDTVIYSTEYDEYRPEEEAAE